MVVFFLVNVVPWGHATGCPRQRHPTQPPTWADAGLVARRLGLVGWQSRSGGGDASTRLGGTANSRGRLYEAGLGRHSARRVALPGMTVIGLSFLGWWAVYDRPDRLRRGDDFWIFRFKAPNLPSSARQYLKSRFSDLCSTKDLRRINLTFLGSFARERFSCFWLSSTTMPCLICCYHFFS